jgi:hypothetical protein
MKITRDQKNALAEEIEANLSLPRGAERAVLRAILRYVHPEHGIAFAGVDRYANDTGASKSTVGRVIRKVRGGGFLKGCWRSGLRETAILWFPRLLDEDLDEAEALRRCVLLERKRQSDRSPVTDRGRSSDRSSDRSMVTGQNPPPRTHEYFQGVLPLPAPSPAEPATSEQALALLDKLLRLMKYTGAVLLQRPRSRTLGDLATVQKWLGWTVRGKPLSPALIFEIASAVMEDAADDFQPDFVKYFEPPLLRHISVIEGKQPAAEHAERSEGSHG